MILPKHQVVSLPHITAVFIFLQELIKLKNVLWQIKSIAFAVL